MGQNKRRCHTNQQHFLTDVESRMKQCLCRLDQMCVLGYLYISAFNSLTLQVLRISTPHLYMTTWNSPSSVDAQQVFGNAATHHHWLIYKHPQITCLIYYFIPVLLPVLGMYVNGHKCHTDISMSDYSPMQPTENISSKLTI